jgi:general secretion pathway protein K
MMSAKPISDEAHDAGFIIIAGLWMLGALATLAAIYALYVHQTTRIMVDRDERLQAQALAAAGVELAVYRLTSVPTKRPVLGQFTFRQGSALVGVQYRSENGNIDLNFAPKDILAGLFIGLGAAPQTALDFADRIIAWRSTLSAGAADPELAIYQGAGKAYPPRHAPFQSVDEIGLVVGMPMRFLERALPYLTVYSGHAEINVLSAPAQVIAALPGMTPDRLQMLLGQRGNVAPEAMQTALGGVSNYITLQPGASDRISVEVRFTSGLRVRSNAVVFILDKDTQPYRVLAWHDQDVSADLHETAVQ